MASSNEYWARVNYATMVPGTLFRFNRKEAREEIWRKQSERWDPYAFGEDLIEGRLERMNEVQVEQHFPGATAA
jgi:hypothetical protein